jgi:branched-chain amino acid transport system ATP-binding protein
MTPARLVATNVRMRFGGLRVTDDVSLTLPAGARTALIGPNGAGKTTLVNLLSGALTPQAGAIALDGVDVTRAPMAARVRAGLVRTFQISRLFRELTMAENVRVAVAHRQGEAMRIFQKRAAAERVAHETDVALRGLDLQRLAHRVVGELSLGEQRLVEIALALAMNPRVLLLDEPAAGVPQGESGRIFDAIERLPSDLAILLIEHDMDLVFRFARHIVVMASGAVLTDGPPEVIAKDERVKEIYFGRAGHATHAH